MIIIKTLEKIVGRIKEVQFTGIYRDAPNPYRGKSLEIKIIVLPWNKVETITLKY